MQPPRTRWLWPMLCALLCQPLAAQTIYGVSEDSSYSYMEDGQVAGVANRIVEALLKQAGIDDYHLSIYPWARSYDLALRDANVLIYPILRNPEREPLFKWVGFFTSAKPVLYKMEGASDIEINTLEDAKKYRIGVMRDDYREKFLQEQGFTRLVVSASNLENFNRLLNGQVQLVPIPERDARKLCQDAHIPFDALEPAYPMEALGKDIYIAFSRATSDETVQRVKLAFEQLQSNGTIQRMLQERP